MPAIWPVWIRDYGTNDTAGVWAKALAGCGWYEVEQALNECVRSQQPRPPTPGQFYAMCVKNRKTTRDVAKSVEERTPKERALFACRSLLHRRLTGDPVPDDWCVAVPNGFDYHGVVWSVTFAKRREGCKFADDMARNTAAYNDMNRIFAEEWAQYERSQRQVA